MFIRMFWKECGQIGKSLIYWLYVVCLVLFFTTQLGGMKENMMTAPKEGQESYGEYGFKENVSERDVMNVVFGRLAFGYYQDHFTTYPVGYAKDIRLSDSEKEEIADAVAQLMGIDKSQVDERLAAYYETEESEETLDLKEGLTYAEFLAQMERVTDILGAGSDFEEGKMQSQIKLPLDYEGAVKAYENLEKKDGYTGGYARLFGDYMGIVLGILPVFVVATRMLRDRRAQMQELVYSRRASSAAVIVSRFLAANVVMMIPVIVLSVLPTVDCMIFTKGTGITLDYLAFLKYDFGWLLPTILAVSAAGMFLTVLTDTALAVLVQAAWWWVSVQTGVAGIRGGEYGWNLIPRHNTEMNYSGFSQGFHQLMMNRVFYVILAVLLVGATVWVYERKRKGHLRRRGKILRNRKKSTEM